MSKFFTPEEANRSLVFVKPILQDIQRHWKILQRLKMEESTEDRVEKIVSHLEKVEYCLEELLQVGCLCRDLKRGLVDFPSYQDGHMVYLCWHINEKNVAHWHPVDQGFGERKVLSALNTNPSSSLAS